MDNTKLESIILAFVLLVFLLMGCKTDPIIPSGGVQLPPPVQDPGEEDLCADGIISFQHQVLPIMVSACAYSGCHDVASHEEGVILDSYENVRKEVKPGNPNDSELYESIVETDPEDIMPPPPAAKLTDTQIGIIRDWITQGANNTDCGAPCDSTAASFSADIFPMLKDYCIGCHNSNRADGNVDIENYAKILPYVNNGSLLGTIRSDEFFPVMPPSGSRLSNCRIAQVEKWIAEGAQNN